MVQESTMICVDNSDWMRNGDFPPTRLQCQQDAVNLIMQCKLRANPENAVGILSMANTVEVLSTLTQESGRLFMKLHSVQPKGVSNFINGIKIAHLALKHRQNRNHKMRIVIFAGSPIAHLDTVEMTRLAKKLKKEKVQVDVVCFGEADSDNSDVMGQFVETLNGKDGSGSNLVVVSAGSNLTEALVSSAVCRGEDGAAAPVVAAGGGGFEFGVDADNDPDLALALRVSLEEERQRQQQEANAVGEGAQAAPQPMDSTTEDVTRRDPNTMTEEEQLLWAIHMSMQEEMGTSSSSSAAAPIPIASAISSIPVTRPPEELMQVDDTQPSTAEDDELGQLMSNPEVLRELVGNLPGVDPNSQEVLDALNNVTNPDNAKSSKKPDDPNPKP